VLHIRLARDSSGIVEVWHRIGGSFPVAPNMVGTGVNVLTVAGVDQNVYPETGYYRSTDARPAILYSSGMWIRSTRPGRGLLQVVSGYAESGEPAQAGNGCGRVGPRG
jgi:hypothetical protein